MGQDLKTTRGVFCIRGADAKSFLHRLSTADIQALAAGEKTVTLLVNAKGRLVDQLDVQILDDGIRCISTHPSASTALQWLDQFIFLDAVELIEEASLPIDNPELEAVKRIAEIEPGLTEICDKYNPLELGLRDAIAWNKGCYIGQEVINRLDSYDKVTKHLVGVLVDGPSFSQIEIGAQVLLDGKAIGELTSVAPSYVPGSVNALAVLKAEREQLDGCQVHIGHLAGRLRLKNATAH